MTASDDGVRHVIANGAERERQPRRNEPCPCGSGKRFKDCHGQLGAEAAASPTAKEEAKNALARGERSAAARSARAAIERDPRDPEAWNLLGLALEPDDAVAARAAWEKALALSPGNAEAHFRIGDLERRLGRHEAAIAAYRAALGTGLRHPVLLNNLGLALRAAGRVDEAARSFAQALEIEPSLAQAHANLADVLREQHRFMAAIPHYTAALELEPQVAQLWLNLGVARHRAGLLGAARQAFERALAIEPDAPEALVNLAASLTAEARYAEALPLLERAQHGAHGSNAAAAQAQGTLLYVKQHTCDWRDLEGAVARQRAALGRVDAPLISPHNLLALPFTPAELRTAAEHWARERIRGPVTIEPAQAEDVDGLLRIGYVVSDFRAHALASLLTGVIEAHDRSRFEIFAYSYGPDDRSQERARFERAFDRFVDVRSKSIEATVQRIRSDRIAVLLDTAGYVLNARSEIFAVRPAPIQINAIGFPGTLGAPWYDYILSDAYVTPPAAESGFSERILRLPHCYLPGDPERHIAPRPTREQCGLPAAGFVFCCFNASYKILPDVFSIWTRLLARVPGSVLWLLDTNAPATEHLRREAEARGVAASRLVFAPRVPLADHLARHAAADLFLDTYPCNAHATANDALFAGLPIVTCSGETFASRVSGSQLTAVGLPELATSSLGAYEALALALAQDPERLARCRERLRGACASSPLFDPRAYARALEALLVAAIEERNRSAG